MLDTVAPTVNYNLAALSLVWPDGHLRRARLRQRDDRKLTRCLLRTSDARRQVSNERQLSARDAANMSEVAAFCGFLDIFVESGGARDELIAVAAALVRRARELRLDAVPVVEAIELIGCPPLRVRDQRSHVRGDRYSDAMACLVRGLIGGA